MDPDLACPMARAPDRRDYFVNEVAIATTETAGGLAAVMIRRWFTIEGLVYASASPLLTTEDQSHLVVDERAEKQIEIPLGSFRWCIDDIIGPNACAKMGSMPSPEKIAGEWSQ